MTSRNELKNVKNVETIHSYFTRVSQIKEHLEAVEEEVENSKVVITTLNGLPGSWDLFIQGMCAKRKSLLSERFWEEHTQEDAQLIVREEKMGATEDQALIIQRSLK